jgi:hypothetical protein
MHPDVQFPNDLPHSEVIHLSKHVFYEGNECTSNGGNCGCDQIAGHCFGCPKDFHGDFCTEECGVNCSLTTEATIVNAQRTIKLKF